MKKPIIFSLIIAFVISLGGIVLEMIAPVSTAIYLAAMIAAFLPIILLAIGLLTSRHTLARMQNTKIADGQAYLLKHREEAEASAKHLMKTLKRYRVASHTYTVILALFAIVTALLAGIFYHHIKLLSAVYLIFATVYFLAVGSRIAPTEPLTLDEKALVVTQESFPRLIRLTEQAKATLAVRESVTVLLTPDTNASIIKNQNRCFLQLGVQLLQLLSEDEFYCILLHEFCHVASHRRAHFTESRHYDKIATAPYNTPSLGFLSLFFRSFDLPFLITFTVYGYANAVNEERDADRAMAKYANPKTAASALVKLEYETKYRYETAFTDDTSIYAEEEMQTDLLRCYLDKFKATEAVRRDFWNTLIQNEILANNATHPTLKMRLEALGVTDWHSLPSVNDPAYQAELDDALAMAQKRINEHQAETFEKDRKARYLEPLSRIAAWEEAGSPIRTETYADIITDFEALCRYSEAEAVCERAIEALPDESTYHAYYTKGLYLLHRYDDRGLDLIYHAIENNHNYLEDGLMEIGTFCLFTGREKELADYRKRAVELAQKNKDENSQADFLSRRDRLTRDTMPDEMREEILSFILSVGGDIIQNVYLVRKTVSESFFSSVFIIHFYGGTDEKRYEIMHKIFRYLDSYPVDWQFSLFDYFDYPEIKVEKIEGALIYTKNKQI